MWHAQSVPYAHQDSFRNGHIQNDIHERMSARSQADPGNNRHQQPLTLTAEWKDALIANENALGKSVRVPQWSLFHSVAPVRSLPRGSYP